MRGHGTYVEGDDLKASVAGVVEKVNKLIMVRPLKTRYNGEVGDVVVGRITELQQKRWKVDTCSRLDSVLLLSSVNLPGGELEFHGSCLRISKAEIEFVSVDGVEVSGLCSDETKMKDVALEDVMKKVTEIFDNQKQAEKNVNTSYEALSDKLDDSMKAVKEQTASLEKCLKMMELVSESRDLRGKVRSLEMRIDDLKQYSRVNSVEIHSIAQQNKDIVAVAKEVRKALDL
ncbi:Exosome complex component RRP4 [Homalodisca vitripennis]|nr:Exosome complex component RRP4 [Homalodisca vitripennis]